MYDFCINGGGMVGSALAIGLAGQGYQVALIEPDSPLAFTPDQGPDLRVSAISHHSVTLLQALGAWPYVEAMRLKPYNALSVWEEKDNATRFDATMAELDHLGYFVENRLIQLGCIQAMAAHSNLTSISGKKVTRIVLDRKDNKGAFVELTLDDNSVITARYLVGADGARSQVRAAANIGSSGWQYDQQAMGITVRLDHDSGEETWQQFTPKGPRAYLPMYDNTASLVWYDSPDNLKTVKGLDREKLKSAIYDAFPDRLRETCPSFSVEGAAVFPLTRSHATHYVLGPVILIGDAAHTINPLAGQGVNLGFKDVEALLSVTAGKAELTSPEFANALKAEYEKPRRRDNLMMMTAMDGFYHLFSNDITPIKWLRNTILTATEAVPVGKKAVLRYALGMQKWKF